jgi:tetratricopeptide (TPR) repeat protein
MGDKGSEARAWAHIGLDYWEQGAYEEARSNYEKAVSIFREIDHQQGLQWVLSLLGWLYIDTDDVDKAEIYCTEALEIAKEAGIKSGVEMCQWLYGRIYLGRGDLDQAERSFQNLLNADFQPEGTGSNSHLYTASLADVLLAKGDHKGALQVVDQIVKSGFEFPEEISDKNRIETLLTCYKVFRYNQDQRACDVISKAYRLIQKQVEKISVEALRKSYLEKVKTNQEVIKIYQAYQSTE